MLPLIMAGIGLAGAALPFFAKEQENPYTKIIADYEAMIAKMKKEKQDLAWNVNDSSFASAVNKSVMAGSVSGVNNPSRVEASVYGQLSETRDKTILDSNNALDYAKAQMMPNLQAKEGEFTANQPNFMNKLTGFINAGGLTSAGALFSELGNLGGAKPVPSFKGLTGSGTTGGSSVPTPNAPNLPNPSGVVNEFAKGNMLSTSKLLPDFVPTGINVNRFQKKNWFMDNFMKDNTSLRFNLPQLQY